MHHVYTYCYKEVDGPLAIAPSMWDTPQEAAAAAGKTMAALFVEVEDRCPYFRLVRVAVED